MSDYCERVTSKVMTGWTFWWKWFWRFRIEVDFLSGKELLCDYWESFSCKEWFVKLKMGMLINDVQYFEVWSFVTHPYKIIFTPILIVFCMKILWQRGWGLKNLFFCVTSFINSPHRVCRSQIMDDFLRRMRRGLDLLYIKIMWQIELKSVQKSNSLVDVIHKWPLYVKRSNPVAKWQRTFNM